jgi:hypothetical protein
VHVCAGGVFHEGPVDRIRGVPVRDRKNYFSSMDLKKNDPVWILARGSGVCSQFGIREEEKSRDGSMRNF